MENYEEIKEKLRCLPSGSRLEVFCEGSVVQKLRADFNELTWRQNDINHFVLITPQERPINRKKIIEDACKNYKGGFVQLDYQESYVRAVVSSFNRMNGTKIHVTVKNGIPVIYGDASERKNITFHEYQEILDCCLNEINEARKLVRPDEFFEMLKPDYDNGMDDLKAEDLEIEPIDFSKFPETPNVSKNCRVCSEEFLTGDPDEDYCDVCRL